MTPWVPPVGETEDKDGHPCRLASERKRAGVTVLVGPGRVGERARAHLCASWARPWAGQLG
jgi:hypothetical protein